MVTGFALLALTPVIYLLYNSMQGYQTETANAQGSAVARDIIATAERAWAHGPPTRLTLPINMPQGILNISIRRHDTASGCTKCTEILMTLNTRGIIVASSAVDIHGVDAPVTETDSMGYTSTIYLFNQSLISPGSRRLTLEAFKDYVELRQS